VNLTRTPLAPVAAAFGAGIALASIAPPATMWIAWLGAAAACVVLLALGRAGLAAGALLLGVVAAGALRAGEAPLASDHIRNAGLPRMVAVEGRLVVEPKRWAPDRVRLLVETERADGAPGSGLIQLTTYGVLPPLTEGQRIAAPMRLHPAMGFRNPGTYDYCGTPGAPETSTSSAPRVPNR
jgi:hypothetical protein